MANRIFQASAKVIKNIEVTRNYCKISLAVSPIARSAKPGQFINIKVSNSDELFLRRPFSIHRVRGSNIEILYEVLGKGTEILSQRKTGESLDIIGPLGNGFNLNPKPYTPHPILIAGGMGVAPLIFLAEKLTELKTQNLKLKTVVLIGAKTKNEILCEKDFKQLGCDIKVSTDDGSKGFKGKVTELLKKILPLAISHKPLAIFACGPKPMLKEIAKISQQHKIPAQVSLEEHMACGIGVCFGCAVKTEDGYKRVCKEGPVFEAPQIIWGKHFDSKEGNDG